MVSLVFRDTNLFTAAASVCGVTLEPTRPTPPSVCAPTDRTPPAVGRSALSAQTANSACSLQDESIIRSADRKKHRPRARRSCVCDDLLSQGFLGHSVPLRRLSPASSCSAGNHLRSHCCFHRGTLHAHTAPRPLQSAQSELDTCLFPL